MRRCFILLVTALIATCSFAQRGLTVDQGAFSSGMGGISTTIQGADAVLGNFSWVTSDDKASFIASTSRRFSLSELSSYSVGAHLPTGKIGHIGIFLFSYGFEAYKENEFALLYAKKLSDNISVSTKLGYHNLLIEDNGSKGSFSYNLGLAGSISESLDYGLLISNPENTSISETTPIISELRLGFAYHVSHKVTSYAEFEKSLEENINFKVGLNYAIHPSFRLRAGYNTDPGNSSLGFSYQILSALCLDASFIYDSLLGITPIISLKWANSQNAN